MTTGLKSTQTSLRRSVQATIARLAVGATATEALEDLKTYDDVVLDVRADRYADAAIEGAVDRPVTSRAARTSAIEALAMEVIECGPREGL